MLAGSRPVPARGVLLLAGGTADLGQPQETSMFQRNKVAAIVALGASMAVAGPAAAVVQPAGAERPLEVEAGKPVRAHRHVSPGVPTGKQRSAARLAAVGLGQTMWDDATGVVLRAWGRGETVVGAVADAGVAAAAARRSLAAWIGDLAPGASPSDFVLVGNAVVGGVRTVGFAQHHRGLPVIGGQVSFAYKRDRLIMVSSQAIPDVVVALPRRAARPADVRAAAVAYLTPRVAGGVRAGAIGARAILPLVRGPGDIELRVVDEVAVAATTQPAAWQVYLDATTGAPIARRSTVHTGAGVVTYQVPDRHPGGTSTAQPARAANHVVDGTPTVADGVGGVSWVGAAPATVAPGLTSAQIVIDDDSGPLATAALTLDDAGTTTWDVGGDLDTLAQLTAFIHGTLVKDHARAWGYPGTSYLDQPLLVVVNEAGACNAYSNGDDIHFFPAGTLDDGTPCGNTGTLPDVVYHEYGHSLHIQGVTPGVGQFDAAVSEGLADLLAALITGDPAMGRGFFVTDEPLRHLDPLGDEATWPDDESFDPHFTGLIIAGAMWDLRTRLLPVLGEEATQAKLHELLWALMARSTDIPSTFVEALVADDDDGDLTNGTPNECAIRDAFAAHGLSDAALMPLYAAPLIDGLSVTLPLLPGAAGANPSCPPVTVTGATISWRLAASPEIAGEVELTEGATAWTGAIPTPATPGVIEAQVRVTLSGGASNTLPDNPADPYYQLYSGALFPVWCASFDDEPTTWTTDGGADDEWAWGVPAPGETSPDPAAAFTGTHVFGTDLGTRGRYESDGLTWAQTPVIDVRGYEGVRLQYRRWLTVEDGVYDQARVVVDDDVLWSNAVGEGGLHHLDGEWRLHDLDLATQAADGSVQVRYELISDGGLEFGGWTLDDVCVMAAGGDGPPAVCGDGEVGGAESCDDGNTADGDGCSATCDLEAGDEPGCCQTGGRPTGPLVLGLATLGLLAWPRRRRARR
ncbi:MAG: hypothetical protein R2939_01195 [Kofleriaceae bacterium]